MIILSSSSPSIPVGTNPCAVVRSLQKSLSLPGNPASPSLASLAIVFHFFFTSPLLPLLHISPPTLIDNFCPCIFVFVFVSLACASLSLFHCLSLLTSPLLSCSIYHIFPLPPCDNNLKRIILHHL